MKPYFLESLVVASAVSLSGCGDNPNEIRKLDCYGVDKIKPSELVELNQSLRLGFRTEARVSEICGSQYSVHEFPSNSGVPTKTLATIIIASDGTKYTLTKDIRDFLIHSKTDESPPGKLKYTTK